MTQQVLEDGFRPATLKDLPGVLALRRRILPAHIAANDSEYLHWRYGLNESSSAGGELYVATAGPRLLGIVGTERLTLRRGDERLSAISLMDILVAPECEAAGIGAWMNLASFERNPIVVEFGANENSLGLVSRLYEPLPALLEYVHHLRSHQYLHKRFGRVAAAILAPAVDSAMAALRWSQRAKLPRYCEFRAIDRFDAADLPTPDGSSTDRAEVTVERVAHSLDWRLFGNPRYRCEVLGLYRAGRLEGYIAWRINRSEAGKTGVVIMDWRCPRNDSHNTLQLLLGELMRRQAQTSASAVRFVASLPVIDAALLRSVGFRGFASKYLTVGLRCRDTTLQSMLRESTWMITQAVTDID